MNQDELLKINLLNQEIIDGKETIANLKENVDQLNVINTKTKEYLFILENRNTHLENKVSALEKQVKQLEKLKGEIAKLNQTISLQNNEIDILNNQKNELIMEIHEKDDDIQQLTEEIEWLHAEINDPQNQNRTSSWYFKDVLKR